MTEQPADRSEVSTRKTSISHRTRGMVLLALCAVLSLVSWLELRSLATLEDRQVALSIQLQQMSHDAHAISRLQLKPARVLDHRRSSDDILAEVEAALTRSGVPHERWQDSVPQQPQMQPDGVTVRHTTRLYLENVELKGLLRFAHELVANDTALSVTTLRLSPIRIRDVKGWDAELSVSYLLVDSPTTG